MTAKIIKTMANVPLITFVKYSIAMIRATITRSVLSTVPMFFFILKNFKLFILSLNREQRTTDKVFGYFVTFGTYRFDLGKNEQILNFYNCQNII
jgi:hypothetical protein